MNLEHMRKRTENREQECLWSQELGQYMKWTGFIQLEPQFYCTPSCILCRDQTQCWGLHCQTKPIDQEKHECSLQSDDKNRLLQILINRTPYNEMKPINSVLTVNVMVHFAGLCLTGLPTRANSTIHLKQFSRRPAPHGPDIPGPLARLMGTHEPSNLLLKQKAKLKHK